MRTRLLMATACAVALVVPAACSSSSKEATPPPTSASTGPAPTRPLNRSVAVPKVIGPVTGGTPDIPMNSMLDAYKAAYGYEEKEFFLEGTATAFEKDGGFDEDGKWSVTPGATAPYRTRILVRTPEDPKNFNGTVVVEWLNTTSGRDADPDFGFAGEELLRSGYAYVAVTAQAVGVHGGAKLPIPGYNPKGMLDHNPERYKGLHHPGDEYSYDIFSQAAEALLHPDGPSPLGSLQPDHLIADGESQSASRLVTYVNAIAPRTNIYDGFMIHSRGDDGSDLNTGADGETPDVAHIRTDVRVPVMMLETETDLLGLGFLKALQPDTNRIRTWQMAGTAHADQSTLDYGITSGRQWDKVSKIPDFTELCGSINDGPESYIMRAAFAAMNAWVANDEPPPTSPAIKLTSTPELARDELGNVIGGIRTPAVDVPTEALSGENGARSPICSLFGTREPFDAATLQRLYATHADYVAKVEAAARRAVKAGFLLPADAAEIVDDAEAAPVPSAS